MRERTCLLTSADDRTCRWSARIDVPSRAPAAPSRSRLARSGERLAAAHLLDVHRLEVLALNHRIAVEDVRGELDIVAFDHRTRSLVVCEVKARSSRSAGGALGALGARQQARIRRMTAVLLATSALRAARVRFDLVAVDMDGGRGTADLVHLTDAW